MNNLSFVIYLSWGKLYILFLLNVATEGFFTKNGLFSSIQIKDKRQTHYY